MSVVFGKVAPSACCCFFAVVFGKVVEGMALVRKAEATGTQSGKPRQPVLIADSGEVCTSYMLYMLLTCSCRSFYCTSACCWDLTASHDRACFRAAQS